MFFLYKNNSKFNLKLKKIPNGYELAFGKEYKYKKLFDIAKQYQNKYELLKGNAYVYNNLEKLGLLNKAYGIEPIEKLSLTNTFNKIFILINNSYIYIEDKLCDLLKINNILLEL